MNLLNRVIKDCATLANGVDFDIGRIAGGLAIIVFFALTIADFILYSHKFDGMQFGTGFGVLIASVSGALLLKHKTEPGGEAKPA